MKKKYKKKVIDRIRVIVLKVTSIKFSIELISIPP